GLLDREPGLGKASQHEDGIDVLALQRYQLRREIAGADVELLDRDVGALLLEDVLRRLQRGLRESIGAGQKTEFLRGISAVVKHAEGGGVGSFRGHQGAVKDVL